jgi:hypothetical protein
VQCQTCGDAGFVKRDNLQPSHPHFGMAIPCPHCAGATKPRNRHAEELAFVQRDQATRPPLPPLENAPLRGETEKIGRRLRPDEEGAHSRWSPPMPPRAGVQEVKP